MSEEKLPRGLAARIDRRTFILQSGVFGLAGFAALGSLATLAGCGSKEKTAEVAEKPHQAVQAAQEVADPCNDLSGLTPEELATRTTFKYEKRASDPTKICKTCNFWQPSPSGEMCGKCTLVKGPIHPLGGCMSWVEKVKT